MPEALAPTPEEQRSSNSDSVQPLESVSPSLEVLEAQLRDQGKEIADNFRQDDPDWDGPKSPPTGLTGRAAADRLLEQRAEIESNFAALDKTQAQLDKGNAELDASFQDHIDRDLGSSP